MEFELNKKLIDLGYKLYDVSFEDFDIYYKIKKENSLKYVEKFYNNWLEDEQLKYNKKCFDESFTQTYFRKICLNSSIVGFVGFSNFEKEIGCVTIQILNNKNRHDLMDWFLNALIDLSGKTNKPIYLKTFIGSSDLNLLKKFGFKEFSKNKSHYLLVRDY